jgi:hypothetical protein
VMQNKVPARLSSKDHRFSDISSSKLNAHRLDFCRVNRQYVNEVLSHWTRSQ